MSIENGSLIGMERVIGRTSDRLGGRCRVSLSKCQDIVVEVTKKRERKESRR